jgi:uncharacterized membrane protein
VIETILSWTQLPNLHPAIVHFPIAFTVLAVLFELAGAARGRAEWLDRAATATWVAAGLGAWAAYWAGEQAADSLTVPPSLQRHLNTHSDWGHYSLYVVGAVAILRLTVALWKPAARDGRLWPVLFLVAGLVAAGVVVRTADLGGGLVYRHGLAVKGEAAGEKTHFAEPGAIEPVTEAPAGEAAESGAARLQRRDDGAAIWTPTPGDAAALGSVLVSAGGGAPSHLSIGDGGPGLALVIGGEGFALLDEPCGDVQVEADVHLGDFEGVFGLAHHVVDEANGGLFTVTRPAGRADLGILSSGAAETLDSADLETPTEVTLAVSGAGRHFRGLVDGALLTHGHRAALPDGRCGLVYDGTGTVYLTALRAIPIE